MGQCKEEEQEGGGGAVKYHGDGEEHGMKEF